MPLEMVRHLCITYHVFWLLFTCGWVRTKKWRQYVGVTDDVNLRCHEDFKHCYLLLCSSFQTHLKQPYFTLSPHCVNDINKFIFVLVMLNLFGGQNMEHTWLKGLQASHMVDCLLILTLLKQIWNIVERKLQGCCIQEKWSCHLQVFPGNIVN